MDKGRSVYERQVTALAPRGVTGVQVQVTGYPTKDAVASYRVQVLGELLLKRSEYQYQDQCLFIAVLGQVFPDGIQGPHHIRF